MSKYHQRGVSADKEDVHAAIKNLDKGLYPTAFCKILPDLVGGDLDFCNIMHSDTAGTKSSLAYMYWQESGDYSVWKGIVQDAIVMNTDDMACVGCTTGIVLSSTVGRNKALIDAQVLKHIIEATPEFIESLRKFDIEVVLAGGETADVGDIVRTVDVGITAFARMRKKELVVNAIRPGQVIVGLASYGQATYESEYNSGIGSNGLTMARHELFKHSYAQLSETYAPQTDPSLVFSGNFGLMDAVEIDGRTYTIGKLALSPTRTFLPVLVPILKQYSHAIHGIIHNTGGALTKVMKYCDEPVRIVKDNLLPVPLIFNLIHNASDASMQEMFKVFNMGTRLELYVDEAAAESIIDIVRQFNIDAQIIGYTTASESHITTVEVHHNGVVYQY